ncbi:MAG: DUF2330 domain-containing protein [Rhodobacter sp.]|nr:DUF2330 domain-containing protein [Rhodobacter sp.]
MRIFLFCLILMGIGGPASAFCGLYVARADGELFNEASRVVFVRDGRRSVITMASDYRGPAAEFAMIVPSPKVLQRNQIRTVKAETVAHLDAYSAPRLVEYEDRDPCQPEILEEPFVVQAAPGPVVRRGPRALGVTVEAEYAVGVYDIAILSARDSDGLVTYLRQEGYRIPRGAELVLADYIADGMKFFVARVNLKRHDRAAARELPPLQISFRSPKFMLPLQLGKINGDTEQQVLLLTLTRKGRVEAANYRNARIPSNIEIPVFVEDVFGQFYRRIFAGAARPDTVVTEYAWDMAWCDPCAADPLSSRELRDLGATWARGSNATVQDVFVTRMHFRYNKSQFQRDLLLRVTEDRSNFQGRYVLRHPYGQRLTCKATEYVNDTRRRLRAEGVALRKLTGWSQREIDKRIRQSVPALYRY